MHEHAYHAVAQMLQMLPKPSRVLEIGSRDINGTVRPLFEGCSYTGIDAIGGPCVDIVADGATYRPTRAPDCVISCEVLEHAPNADAIVAHMAAIVAPGGSVIITCAADFRAPHSAIDGGPLKFAESYQNIAPEDLRAWLEAGGLTMVDLTHRADRGDLYACATKPASGGAAPAPKKAKKAAAIPAAAEEPSA